MNHTIDDAATATPIQEHSEHQPSHAPLGAHEGHEPSGPGNHGGHGGGLGKHAGHHVEMFRRRFWWSLLLTVPVVLTSHMVMEWFGYDLDFYGMEWVGPVLGSVIFLWGGWPFLEGGRREIQQRQPGMMLLIAMAITVAYGASMATSLDWFDLDFWWELSLLVTIMLLGHWQEMKALGQAQDALAALAALLPDEAERVGADGEVETIALDELRAGDVVLVRSGGRVPADGEIVEGSAELDESMITGESKPVTKDITDRVVAGTVSTDSAIRVRVDAFGEETTLAGIQRLVAQAQESRSRAQALADRAAALLFYVATAAAAITAVVWLAIGDADDAVVRVVTVLVISCPHALGLAIPLTTSLSSAMAARNGILIKDRLALEESRTVDAFLFDKTGTLTKGEHTVVGVAGINLSDDEVLRLAGGVESDSEHPLARAIVTAARSRGPVSTASDFRSITGRGVEAAIDGHRYAVGGPALLRERSLTEPVELAEWSTGWKNRGAAVLFLGRGDTIVGGIALEDAIRPEARDAVTALQAMGRRVIMITGDAHQVADAVGADLGVDEVFAEVLPEEKDAKVAELQARGLKVAMVGDGVNDAPALARADVGIAIGAGTDVAIESAGLILATSDPRAVVGIIRLSRAAYRKSLQNLWWAAGYNLAAIPIAAGALAWAGVSMPPAVAAVLMSVSTIVVAANAQLLRRVALTLTGELDVAAGRRHHPHPERRGRTGRAARLLRAARRRHPLVSLTQLPPEASTAPLRTAPRKGPDMTTTTSTSIHRPERPATGAAMPATTPTIDATTNTTGRMRAIIQRGYGSVEVLHAAEVAVPMIEDDEVLIEVRAAGLDRGTWHLMAGYPYAVRLATGLRTPRRAVVGIDVAGIVVGVGSKVHRFQIGDEVFGVGKGTFAERTVAKEAKLAMKPPTLSFEQAAAIPVSGLTALQAMDVGRVQAGQHVLVIGASGGVGTYAVQLAKALGATVTGVSSTAKLDLVRAVGADHVIDYSLDDFAAGRQRYDVILDIGGNASLSRLRRALTTTGTLVIVGGEDGGRWTGMGRQLRALALSPLVRQRLRTMMAKEHHTGLERLAELVAAGSLTPAIERSYPLNEAASAMRHLVSGNARGKLVISVGPF